MRSLDSCRSNYLYGDWPEVEASTQMAGAVLKMPYRGKEEETARHRWASLLEQPALFKRTRWINWRVPSEAPTLSPDLLADLQDLGQLVDQLLSAVDRTIDSDPLIGRALGFPACPEERALWEIQRFDPLCYYRLDLALDQDSRPKLLEIQIVAGGLGITQALRTTYGDHLELPGIAALYEEAVTAGARSRESGAVSDSPGPRLVAVVGSARSAYRHDHLVLSRHLRDLEMVVAPLGAITFDLKGRPTLPDGRVLPAIHRLFRSPSLFQRNPGRARCLAESIYRGHVRMVNPWKDWLEDKRVLTLVHHSEASGEISKAFAPGDWDRLTTFVPRTRLAGPEEIAGLLGRPRSQRGYYLKKGRSFESRQLVDGQQVSLRQWEAACLQAREDGDWIVQETVRGRAWSFQFLDLQRQEMRAMEGHLRLSPFYFRGGDGTVRLGDVLITAREAASRIHGASDAILVVPGSSP